MPRFGLGKVPDVPEPEPTVDKPCGRCGVRVPVPESEAKDTRWARDPACIELRDKYRHELANVAAVVWLSDALGEQLDPNDPAVYYVAANVLRGADHDPRTSEWRRPVSEQSPSYLRELEGGFTYPLGSGTGKRWEFLDWSHPDALDRDGLRREIKAERKRRLPKRQRGGTGCAGCGVDRSVTWWQAVGLDGHALCDRCKELYSRAGGIDGPLDRKLFGQLLYTEAVGLKQTVMGQPSLRPFYLATEDRTGTREPFAYIDSATRATWRWEAVQLGKVAQPTETELAALARLKRLRQAEQALAKPVRPDLLASPDPYGRTD